MKKSRNLFRSLFARGGFEMVNMKLARAVGLNASLLLSYLGGESDRYYENDQLDENEFFYKDQKTIRKKTTLSGFQQSAAIRLLEEQGFLIVERRGVPRRNFFKVLDASIIAFFEQDEQESANAKDSRNLSTGTQETGDLYYNKTNIKTKRLLSEDKSSSRRTEPGGSGFTGKLHRRSKATILKSKKSGLPHKAKTPEPLPKVPAKVKSVMKYWEGRGLHISREGTKAHRDSIKKVAALFAGRAFNHSEFEEYQKQRFSIKDIRRAVDRFALAALNPHYLPVAQYKKKLRGMPIGAFIYSPFSQNGTGRSQFIHYLENAPTVTGVPVEALEDPYPKMTSALKRFYKREVLGGVEPKMEVREENHFVMASQKLLDFVKKNRGKLRWYQELTPSVLAGWVGEALRQATGDDLSKVSPGWFSSEMMFNRRLPAYLTSQALLGEEVDMSGGTRVGFLH